MILSARNRVHMITAAAVVAAGFAFFATPGDAAGPAASRLEVRACKFKQVNLRKMECYWLVAPLRRDITTDGRARIPVTIFRARPEKKGRKVEIKEPVVLLTGGPGGHIGAVAKSYKHWLHILKVSRWIGNRDLILLEQRGVQDTKPELNCVEERDMRGRASSLKRFLKAMMACHYRMTRWRGYDLAGYTTGEIVSDIIDIRRLLRIKKWTLWGGSYGSLLALETLRRDEAATKSVVISGIVPPHTAHQPFNTERIVRSVRRMVAACNEQKDCKRAFPKLEESMWKAVRRLRYYPIQTAVVGGDNVGGFFYTINDSMLMDSVFGAMYNRKSIRFLPMIIKATLGKVDRAYIDILAQGADASYYRSSLSAALLYTVDCNDRFGVGAEPPKKADGAQPAVHTGKPVGRDTADREPPMRERFYIEFRKRMEIRSRADLALCRVWRATKTSSIKAEPVRSKVPVLLINGWLDPITPPENAFEAAKYLPNSHVVIMRHAAHSAELTKCGVKIKRSFIENPMVPPKKDCLKKMKPIKFVVKEGKHD